MKFPGIITPSILVLVRKDYTTDYTSEFTSVTDFTWFTAKQSGGSNCVILEGPMVKGHALCILSLGCALKNHWSQALRVPPSH